MKNKEIQKIELNLKINAMKMTGDFQYEFFMKLLLVFLIADLAGILLLEKFRHIIKNVHFIKVKSNFQFYLKFEKNFEIFFLPFLGNFCNCMTYLDGDFFFHLETLKSKI